MKQVIWVVGTSSAGKKTFMNTLQREISLQNELGLKDKKIAIVQRSVDFTGDTTMPDVVRERELIPHDAAELLNENDVVLIKWQYLDSSYNIPEKLKAGVLNCRHSIVWLTANKAESINRLNNNKWWKQKGFETAQELYNFELDYINYYISKLNNDFPIIKLNSSALANYSPLKFEHK